MEVVSAAFKHFSNPNHKGRYSTDKKKLNIASATHA